MKPRVLMIAEACNPQWVSVPLVGWNQVHAMSQIADVHLVTQIRNAPDIEAAGWVRGRDFTAIDSERLAAPVFAITRKFMGEGKAWTLNTATATFVYYYFESLLWNQLGHRIRAGEWDVVHRVTPLSPTTPSLLARHCHDAGVPFILGPLNGGVAWPREFDSRRRAEREWLSYVRGAYRLLPGYRSTRALASAILVASKDTLAQMPTSVRDKCVYIPENGIDPARFSHRRTPNPAGPLRVVFVGRLVPYKGADMLIEAAVPLLRAGDVSVQIIGDGPEAPALKKMAADYGVLSDTPDKGVHFPGWIPHAQMPARLAEFDVLGFPSIREFGGGVVLEAMAAGVVPLIINYGGPGELVTDSTGIAIPLGSRQAIVQRLQESLKRLATNRPIVESMSAAAWQSAHTKYTWAAKAQETMAVYESVQKARRHKGT